MNNKIICQLNNKNLYLKKQANIMNSKNQIVNIIKLT